MSFEAWVDVDRRSKATRIALFLLKELANFADEEGYSWPSSATLARKIGYSAKHVKALLAELEAMGEIVRAGHGQRGVIRWHLTPGGVAVGASEPEAVRPVTSRCQLDGSDSTSRLPVDAAKPVTSRSHQSPGGDTTLFKNIPPLRVPPMGGEAVPGRRGRKTPLPAGWVLPPEWRGDAEGILEAAGVAVDIAAEARAFENKARASDVRWVDWRAAWRNWIEQAVKFARRDGKGKPAPADSDPMVERVLRRYGVDRAGYRSPELPGV